MIAPELVPREREWTMRLDPAARPSGPPRVSVVLTTYNHARYIREAVEGVLMQRTTFPIELIITEDCSTDGTREIVQELAAQHPDLIRLMLSERNLNTNTVSARAIAAARGEYTAHLDGDDYWTDPGKLQRQADFLDAYPDCPLCFHDVVIWNEARNEAAGLYVRLTVPRFSTLPQLLTNNCIPGCSPMFRTAALRTMPAWVDEAEYGDWPTYLLLAQTGPVGFIPDVMGVYRMHPDGYWSRLSFTEQLRMDIRFLARVRPRLGRRYDRDVRRSMALRYFQLGTFAEENFGDLPSAAAETLRSIRLSPFHPGIPPGRRLGVVLRRYAWPVYRVAVAARAVVRPVYRLLKRSRRRVPSQPDHPTP